MRSPSENLPGRVLSLESIYSELSEGEENIIKMEEIIFENNGEEANQVDF